MEEENRYVRPGSGFAGRAVALLLLVSTACAARAEPPATATGICASCHGAGGVSPNPVVPTLAGQPYTLIEDNLLAFRAGKRSCSPERADGSPAAVLAQTMCGHVKQLTDGEIAGLAEYYSSLEFVPAEQGFEQELAARGAEIHRQAGCNRCHAQGGRETLGMAPVLAGQWTPFLRRALFAVRAGKRSGPKMMNEPLRRLDVDDVDALLNFYASQQDRAPR